METVIGVLLILSFIGLAIYAAKGGNLTIGMILIGTTWSILALTGNIFVANEAFRAANESIMSMSWLDIITKTYQSGPEGWGTLLVNVMFGAWFGQTILQTGIAATIIKKTVELGGDRPTLTCILLSIGCTLIFSAIYSPGAVIAIALIAIPIMLSIGISKTIATVAFVGSVGAGMYLNPVIFNQYYAFYTDMQGANNFTFQYYYPLGVAAAVIQLIILFGIIIVGTRDKKRYTWAVEAADESAHVPLISLITPIVPVLLLLLFDIPIIPGFLIGGFYAYLTTGKMKEGFSAVATMFSKDFTNGVAETAPVVSFLLSVTFLNAASSLCGPYFNALLGNIIPDSMLTLTIIFILIVPFAFFRGPLSLVGSGAATLAILKSVGYFSLDFLYPLMVIPTITITISSCISQSWTAWTLGYTKVSIRDFLKITVPFGWSVCAILYILNFARVALF